MMLSTFKHELAWVLIRLSKSEGRISRRNALRELDKFLARTRRALRAEYPPIGKDGKLIVSKLLPIGQRRCFGCHAYTPSVGVLARHLVKTHGGKCLCGWEPTFKRSSFTPYRLNSRKAALIAGHLRRAGDLSIHFTLAGLQKIGGAM